MAGVANLRAEVRWKSEMRPRHDKSTASGEKTELAGRSWDAYKLRLAVSRMESE